MRCSRHERDVKDWTDEELVSELVESYEPSAIPPCRVCGDELDIQSAGGGKPTAYACVARLVKDGVDCGVDWDHYTQSRFEDYRQGGDDRVIEAVRRWQAVTK